MDLNPKQFVRSNLTEDSLFISKREELGKEDDDPLSIWGKSLKILGFVLAASTIVLPTISVFLERPLLQDYGVISNQRIEKDGY
tara:strand:+ start:31826 stop:32077 length:252 start_codon:yes stop_codon:yes gene_type:complete